jgi:hypothetical protein
MTQEQTLTLLFGAFGVVCFIMGWLMAKVFAADLDGDE